MATVEKRGKGYRITVAAGIGLDGRQIRRRTIWTPDPKMTPRQVEKELARQVVKFEEQVKAGGGGDGGNIRFADFAARYMEEYGKLYLKPTTLANYQGCLVRINQAIGHLRLKDITPLHIQAFYRNLQEEGVRQKVTAQATPALAAWQQGQKLSQAELARRAGVSRPTVGQALKGRPVSLDSAQKLAAVAGQPVGVLFQVQPNTSPLSAATIHAYHRVLSSILKRAVRWRCIPANPAEGAELPSLAGHSAHYLDEPDARRMLQLLLSEPIKWAAPVIFDLLSGLRRAELLGLRWQDVDLDAGLLRVAQSWNYVPGTGTYISTPKTEGSIRCLRISTAAVAILRTYKTWQDGLRSSLGDAWQDTDGRVFTSEMGRPIFPSSLTAWLRKFIRRTGLPPSSVHSLRHTYASLLLAERTPLVVVAHNLGHAQASTTANIYAHTIQSAEVAAAGILDRFADGLAGQGEANRGENAQKFI
ncbi:MAG TPA: tyrosine-type recombinase/integrase [Candidatus Faecalibacterium intestinigallinarum]|uniref:Tyrosine-type recombinase/integrase n=1 Tax=Candidatus Faecalibacterium intestinigallinarum TaxID=2838581 RepID=A0A9D1TVN4_9FIRM|nr:tyrosine-type recombinase/integrase [Candidatus Faecalibacterium intestinigallinarum]